MPALKYWTGTAWAYASGPTGPQGSQGVQGAPSSVVGPQGPQGAQGDVGPSTGAAGGDLSGTYPNPTVVALQGTAVSNVKPVSPQVLAYNGINWYPTTLSTAPTGTASGDLSGIYPGPTVAQIRGRPVANVAPSNGQVLGWQAAGATWTPITVTGAQGPQGLQGTQGSQGNQGTQGAAGSPTGAAGGDLQGTYPNPTVVNLTALTGYPVPPYGAGGASVPFLNLVGGSTWQWQYVTLGGDIVMSNWAAPNFGGNVTYQVRGLYGVPMTGAPTYFQGFIHNGSQMQPIQQPFVISQGISYHSTSSVVEMMNNGGSIPTAYSQGLYRLSGTITTTGGDNVTVTVSWVDDSGARRSTYPLIMLPGGGWSATNAVAIGTAGVYPILSFLIRQNGTGIGNRIIVSVGGNPGNGTYSSFILEQFTNG